MTTLSPRTKRTLKALQDLAESRTWRLAEVTSASGDPRTADPWLTQMLDRVAACFPDDADVADQRAAAVEEAEGALRWVIEQVRRAIRMDYPEEDERELREAHRTFQNLPHELQTYARRMPDERGAAAAEVDVRETLEKIRRGAHSGLSWKRVKAALEALGWRVWPSIGVGPARQNEEWAFEAADVTDLIAKHQQLCKQVLVDAHRRRVLDSTYILTVDDIRHDADDAAVLTYTSGRGIPGYQLITPDGVEVDLFGAGKDPLLWAMQHGAKEQAAAYLGQPAHVPAAPRLEADTGECPICHERFKLDGGRLVQHGFRRPRGWHVTTGGCPGVGELPLEVSADGAVRYQAALQARLRDAGISKDDRAELVGAVQQTERTLARWRPRGFPLGTSAVLVRVATILIRMHARLPTDGLITSLDLSRFAAQHWPELLREADAAPPPAALPTPPAPVPTLEDQATALIRQWEWSPRASRSFFAAWDDKIERAPLAAIQQLAEYAGVAQPAGDLRGLEDQLDTMWLSGSAAIPARPEWRAILQERAGELARLWEAADHKDKRAFVRFWEQAKEFSTPVWRWLATEHVGILSPMPHAHAVKTELEEHWTAPLRPVEPAPPVPPAPRPIRHVPGPLAPSAPKPTPTPPAPSALPPGFDSFDEPTEPVELTPEDLARQAFEDDILHGQPAAQHALAPHLQGPLSGAPDAFFTGSRVGATEPWYVWAAGAATAAGAVTLGQRLRAALRGGASGRGLPADLPHLHPRPLYVGWVGGRVGPLGPPPPPPRWGARGVRYDEACERCGREGEVDNTTGLCRRCGG